MMLRIGMTFYPPYAQRYDQKREGIENWNLRVASAHARAELEPCSSPATRYDLTGETAFVVVRKRK